MAQTISVRLGAREITRSGGRAGLVTAAGAAVALPLGSTYAQQAEFSYKYANNLPVTHPMNIRAKEMVDAIRARTAELQQRMREAGIVPGSVRALRLFS